MYKKKYLCHTWQDNQLVGSRRFDSRDSLVKFLRTNNAHFPNCNLSDLQDDSVEIFTTDQDLFYEVEALAEELPDYIVADNQYYVSLPLWAKQHNMTTRKANSYKYRMPTIKKGERLYIQMESTK